MGANQPSIAYIFHTAFQHKRSEPLLDISFQIKDDMRLTFTKFALLAFLSAVPAAAADCPEHFVGGAEPPTLVNPRLATRARGLCFLGYAVLHSGATRTPLWSAEHLTADRVDAARGVRRTNRFHPEGRLPPDERSELSDYARSGYDRGHMAPSGDMPDEGSQAKSFSLANMVPQAHRLNTGLWSEIEGAVRGLARRDGEIYVVTGPVFQGADLQALRGRVIVPTSVFKAVYDPKRGTAGAYLAPNADDAGWEAVSIARLREMTGLEVFPSLPEAVRVATPQLPKPQARGRRPRPR